MTKLRQEITKEFEILKDLGYTFEENMDELIKNYIGEQEEMVLDLLIDNEWY